MSKKNFYNKYFTTFKQITQYIQKISNDLNSIKGVNDIFTFGEIAEYFNKSNYHVKDANLLIKTTYHPDDLLAIIDDKNSPIHYASHQKIEEDGYDPNVVFFTKILKKYDRYNIQKWAKTNNKYLHWGVLPQDQTEWEGIQKEAQQYANEKVEKSLKQTNWHYWHQKYINQYFGDAPKGWYQTNFCPQKNIIKI